MKVYTWYPIRCTSCNKHVGHLAMDIRARLESGETLPGMYASDYVALRVCCKSALMNPCAYNRGAQDRKAVYGSEVDGTLPPVTPVPGHRSGRVRLVESQTFEGVYIGERTSEEPAQYQQASEEPESDLGGEESEQLVVLADGAAPRDGTQVPRVPGIPGVDLIGGPRYTDESQGTGIKGLLGRAYLAV